MLAFQFGHWISGQCSAQSLFVFVFVVVFVLAYVFVYVIVFVFEPLDMYAQICPKSICQYMLVNACKC